MVEQFSEKVPQKLGCVIFFPLILGLLWSDCETHLFIHLFFFTAKFIEMPPANEADDRIKKFKNKGKDTAVSLLLL